MQKNECNKETIYFSQTPERSQNTLSPKGNKTINEGKCLGEKNKTVKVDRAHKIKPRDTLNNAYLIRSVETK